MGFPTREKKNIEQKGKKILRSKFLKEFLYVRLVKKKNWDIFLVFELLSSKVKVPK